MPRPPRQDPDLTRAQILEIARRQVLSGGVGQLSLRAIARELGYSAGSIYQHFAGKESILRTLSERASARMRERLSISMKSMTGGSAPARPVAAR